MSSDESQIVPILLVSLLILSAVFLTTGIGRLLWMAWSMPHRGKAIWQVVIFLPRTPPDWPNTSRESLLILAGGLLGIAFCVGYLWGLIYSFAHQ